VAGIHDEDLTHVGKADVGRRHTHKRGEPKLGRTQSIHETD
jgi:hypothetical protein